MTAQHVNQGQQRLLKVMLALAGNEFQGVSCAALAGRMQPKELQSTILRDLVNLQMAGLAEQIETTGHWRLGPKLVQIALAYGRELSRADDALADLKNRYSREAR